jgi:dienelactone hydrolase
VSRWTGCPAPAPRLPWPIIGELDPYTPPEDVTDLARAGVEVRRYERAEHGFVHDASRPSHRPDDAADAWANVIGFLRQ